MRAKKTGYITQEALEKLDAIFDAKAGSEQGKELENLVSLIDRYEKEHFPVEMPDAVEAIKFRTEQPKTKYSSLNINN